MSLVGTRPILQDELQKYELHHRARIAIKPGITGMWQVSGRSDITDFEEVVRLDTEYISLLDRLDELYKTYGYCLNTLHSYEFDGSAGFARMQSIMQAFRGGIKEFGGKKVVRLLDYVQGLDGLPKSDVLKFLLEDNCSLVVRPSGTEPKLKIYISVSAENKEMAEEVEDEIAKTAEKWIC